VRLFSFEAQINVRKRKQCRKQKKTLKNYEKKTLKNIRRRIFYRLQTSADVKRHQKTSADENFLSSFFFHPEFDLTRQIRIILAFLLN
jgi:hypothetical protein